MYTSLLNDESKVGFQNMQNQTNLNATGKEDLQIAKLKRMQVKFSKIYRWIVSFNFALNLVFR